MLGLSVRAGTYCVTLGRSLDLFSLTLCIWEEWVGTSLGGIWLGLSETLYTLSGVSGTKCVSYHNLIIDIQTEEYIYLRIILILDLRYFHARSIYLFNNQHAIKSQENRTVSECRTRRRTWQYHSSPHTWVPSPLTCFFDTWKPMSISRQFPCS